MKKIIIIGAGGHAKVIYDILMSIKRKKTDDVEVLGFLDDSFDHLACRELFELPIIGKISRLDEFAGGGIFCVCAIGNNGARRNICDKYAQFKFYTAIHPSASIGTNVSIGEGTVVMANAVINPDTRVGKHAIINTSSVVEHDNIIGDWAHICPGTVLCGGVRIGDLTWVGANSTAIPKITVGSRVMVGAGTTIIRDIPDDCTVAGNPARILKNRGI